jgi:hypothetical protein
MSLFCGSLDSYADQVLPRPTMAISQGSDFLTMDSATQTFSAQSVGLFYLLGLPSPKAKVGKSFSLSASGHTVLMTDISLDDCVVINSRGKFALNRLQIGNGYVSSVTTRTDVLTFQRALRSGSRLLSRVSVEENSTPLEHRLLAFGEIAEVGVEKKRPLLRQAHHVLYQ